MQKKQTGSHRKPSVTGQEGGLGVTWTGGHAGTFLDVLPLTGCASVQRGGVGAAPTPLLPATPTHSAAGRPGGPRGPAAVDCQDQRRAMEGWGREKVGGRGGWMKGQSSQDYPTCTKRKRCEAPTSNRGNRYARWFRAARRTKGGTRAKSCFLCSVFRLELQPTAVKTK